MSEAERTEWEIEAERAAASLNAEIDALDAQVSCDDRLSYRVFWTTVRTLQERVRTAPAIKLEDKFALQGRLRTLTNRVSQAQKETRRESAATRAQFLDALNLVRESLEETLAIAEIHEMRADLGALRQRIERDSGKLDQVGRQEVWNSWQAANQAAWNALTSAWKRNEDTLSALLEEARNQLAVGRPREARDKIRAFQAETAKRETSHNARRELRSKATALWRESEELSRRKHADYLSHAGRRLQQWKQQRARESRSLEQVAADIAELERRSAQSSTDVAAALLRGQIAERRKALRQIESTISKLEADIASVEDALART